MKLRHIACMSVVLLGPSLSHATLPAPDTLGKLETILNLCIKVDPQNASQYEVRRPVITGGASASQVSLTRDTPQYETSVESTSARLAKLPKATVLSACTAFLQGK